MTVDSNGNIETREHNIIEVRAGQPLTVKSRVWHWKIGWHCYVHILNLQPFQNFIDTLDPHIIANYPARVSVTNIGMLSWERTMSGGLEGRPGALGCRTTWSSGFGHHLPRARNRRTGVAVRPFHPGHTGHFAIKRRAC